MLKALWEARWMPIQSRPGARAAGIVTAILVNWVIRTIGSLAGADFVVLDRGETTYVTYAVLAIFTTGISLVGWGILAVLERITRFGKAIWTTGATCLLLLSAVPIIFAQAAMPSKIFLAIINTATYFVVVPVMRKTALRKEKKVSAESVPATAS
jgi:hypothetical protein